MGRVTRALEPVHRLAHLANGASLERERRDVDHAFVAVVQGPQPVQSVELEVALAGAEHRDPPVALVRESREGGQQALDRIALADWIAGDDGDARDHLVRQEGALVGREEVRLVRAKDEGRQRVDAVAAHES